MQKLSKIKIDLYINSFLWRSKLGRVFQVRYFYGTLEIMLFQLVCTFDNMPGIVCARVGHEGKYREKSPPIFTNGHTEIKEKLNHYDCNFETAI